MPTHPIDTARRRWLRRSPLALAPFVPTAFAPLFSAAGAQTMIEPATTRTAVSPATDRVVARSVHLPLPPAQAFNWFTDNTLLQTWLTAVAEVEPRVGGKYELFWQPDRREDNSTIGCRVTAIAPAQLVAFTWRSPVQFKPFANAADPLTHVVVSFAAEGDGTRVHLIHSGWRGSAEWEQARAWQDTAWKMAFEALAGAVARPR